MTRDDGIQVQLGPGTRNNAELTTRHKVKVVIGEGRISPESDADPHRPEWLDGVPTGWCECGQPLHAALLELGDG